MCRMKTTPPPPPNQKSNLGFFALILVALIGAAITMVVLSQGSSTDAASGDSEVNESRDPVAPDFTVELFDGTVFNLNEHLETDGRPVVLNLWASWCPPCRAEMPDFDEFQAERPGVLVLGVAVLDEEEKARALAEELDLSYTLGIDLPETVAAAYPPIGMPSTWFIGADGTIKREVTGQISLEQLRELSAGAFGF